MPRLAAAAVSCTLALACDTVAPQSPSADRDFALRAGETARIEGSDLAIRFDDVPSDSRCPVDVQCITAGDATVSLHLTGGGAEPAAHELHTLEPPRELRRGGWTVALVKLDPRPVSTRGTPRSDYVVTLKASRVP